MGRMCFLFWFIVVWWIFGGNQNTFELIFKIPSYEISEINLHNFSISARFISIWMHLNNSIVTLLNGDSFSLLLKLKKFDAWIYVASTDRPKYTKLFQISSKQFQNWPRIYGGKKLNCTICFPLHKFSEHKKALKPIHSNKHKWSM